MDQGVSQICWWKQQMDGTQSLVGSLCSGAQMRSVDVLVALVEAESLRARRICSIRLWAVCSHSEVGNK